MNMDNTMGQIKSVKEIISESKVVFEQNGEKLSISIDVKPNGVMVFLIE